MSLRVVPWMTDESVRFLDGFITAFARREGRGPHVLEFGSGASTLWLGQRAASLIAIEHDAAWHARVVGLVAALGLAEVRVHLEARPYHEKASEHAAGRRFEIVSIDGRDRVACLGHALRRGLLAPGGVLVLDNTERVSGQGGRYRRMLDLLDPDFRVVHFEQTGTDRAGWKPTHRWVTTIAWRREMGHVTSAGVPL